MDKKEEYFIWSEDSATIGTPNSLMGGGQVRGIYGNFTLSSEIVVLQVGPTVLMTPISIQSWGMLATFFIVIIIISCMYKDEYGYKGFPFPKALYFLDKYQITLTFGFSPSCFLFLQKRGPWQFPFSFPSLFPWIVRTLPHECGTLLHVI